MAHLSFGRLDPTIHPVKVINDHVSSHVKDLHWLKPCTHCVILDKQRDLAVSLTLELTKPVLDEMHPR